MFVLPSRASVHTACMRSSGNSLAALAAGACAAGAGACTNSSVAGGVVAAPIFQPILNDVPTGTTACQSEYAVESVRGVSHVSPPSLERVQRNDPTPPYGLPSLKSCQKRYGRPSFPTASFSTDMGNT